MVIKVRFLGTGTSQGVPVIGCKCKVCMSTDKLDKRLRTSVYIQVEGKHIVIDTGPDFRQQALNAKMEKLDAVLFTHEHKDHTAGLDDIRAFNFLQKRDMDVYATKQVQESIRKAYDYVFADHKYPGVPAVKLHSITKEPFFIEKLKVIPIQAYHHKLPVLGFRFGDFTYITDANYISEQEKEKIKGTRVLVLNALRQKEHISHFTLQEAVELANDFNVERAYLTHISHQMGFHSVIEEDLPDHIHLAYDGLTIEI